jgi:hypothetical protein
VNPEWFEYNNCNNENKQECGDENKMKQKLKEVIHFFRWFLDQHYTNIPIIL